MPTKSPGGLAGGFLCLDWDELQLLNSRLPAAFSSLTVSSALTGR
jgi:hypothetical protein